MRMRETCLPHICLDLGPEKFSYWKTDGEMPREKDNLPTLSLQTTTQRVTSERPQPLAPRLRTSPSVLSLYALSSADTANRLPEQAGERKNSRSGAFVPGNRAFFSEIVRINFNPGFQQSAHQHLFLGCVPESGCPAQRPDGCLSDFHIEVDGFLARLRHG